MKYRFLYETICLVITCMLNMQLAMSQIKSYSDENGISFNKKITPLQYNAHGQNFRIIQDKRGVFYFANFAGILEYDGTNWKTIPTRNNSRVLSLCIDKVGRIYAGSDCEFGYLEPDSTGSMTFLLLSNKINDNAKNFGQVNNILNTSSGIAFIAEKQIFLWDGKKITTILSDLPILFSYYVADKLFINQKGAGLAYLNNKKIVTIPQSPQIPKKIEVKGMFAADNKIIIATENLGLLQFDDHNIITKFQNDADDYLSKNLISSCIQTNNNLFLFSTIRKGLLVLNKYASFNQVIEKNAIFQDERINSIFQDNDGNVWFALNNGLAIQELFSPLSYFDKNMNLAGEITGIIRHNGEIYFATSNGLFCLQNSYITRVGDFKASLWGLVEFDNTLLAASNTGIYQITNNTVHQIIPDFSLSILHSQSDKAKVYVGLLDGVIELKYNGGWSSGKRINGISSTVNAIHDDKFGNIWLETLSNGLFRYNPKEDKVVQYDTTKGLPFLISNHLNTISKEIVVTTRGGIYKFDNYKDRFVKYDLLQSNNQQNEWIFKIVEDKQGNLYATQGDEKMISRYSKNGETFEQQVIPFLSIKNNIIHVIYPDNDSIVWFGGPDGAIRFDSKLKKNYSVDFTVLIRKVTLGNDSVIFNGTYYNSLQLPDTLQPENLVSKLQYNFNDLRFEYSATGYNINEELNYQYLLEGYDKTWSEWINKTQKEYTNLPPGNYVFHVRAKNIYNHIGKTANYKFIILTPFYRTFWAIFIYIILIGLIVFLIIKWRLRAITAEKHQLENIIKERTGEIVQQKSEIELQSAELSIKNDQLEKIDMIVQSINREINFASLHKTVIEKLKIIKGTELATILVYVPESNKYAYKATLGFDYSSIQGVQISPDEAESRYIAKAEEIYEDIFLKTDIKFRKSGNALDKLITPKAMLTVVINIDNHVDGYIVLSNLTRHDAFDKYDFIMLKNLKEHLIGAFIKTKNLENLEKTIGNLEKTYQDLKDTQAQLIRHEKLASIGQLTKGIVDRILNPLNYINNFSGSTNDLTKEVEELVEKEKDKINGEVFDEIIDIFKMAKDNLAKIMEHGTSATRIVKGMEKLLREKSTDFSESDSNALIESTMTNSMLELKKEYKDFSINLVKQYDKSIPKVEIMPFELSQVIISTIQNSYYALNEKKKNKPDFTPEIVLSTKLIDDYLEIKIKDNGKGIPEKELTKLFNPFFTTKPTSKGTGLGLYMSKDIIEIHKGKIDVNTIEGEYTELIFRLPVKKLPNSIS